MRIIFFGTCHFAKEVLASLLEKRDDLVAIVTHPDTPQGRGQKLSSPPVKAWAEEHGWQKPLFQPEKASDPAFIEAVRALQPDLFVVVSYGHILRQILLDVPRLGCINVHPSILPNYRGPSPIQTAVLSGDREIGVTIMEMVLKMDAGDIIRVAKMPLPEEMSFGEAESALAALAALPLLETIEEFEKRGKVERRPQEESSATYCKKITTVDAVIDWKAPCRAVHNLIRGMNPKPGARCTVEIGGKKFLLKILQAKMVEGAPQKPGNILFFDRFHGWQVSCGDGILSILEVQLEGKKRMPVIEFINGFKQPLTISFYLH